MTVKSLRENTRKSRERRVKIMLIESNEATVVTRPTAIAVFGGLPLSSPTTATRPFAAVVICRQPLPPPVAVVRPALSAIFFWFLLPKPISSHF